MKEYSVIGKRVERIDAIDKALGEAKYTSDIKLNGMLYGKILRSPYPHAKILNVDTTFAEKIPGVKAIITYKNVPRITYNNAGFPPSEGLYAPKDQYVFDDKVCFIGDGVAGVAATSEDIASEVVELIKVDYEELPYVFDPEEAMKPEAPKVHSLNSNILFHIPIEIGDIEKGFNESDYIFEDRYETSRVSQCTVEPCGISISHFDINGRLTIWTSTQMPHTVRRLLSEILNIPVGKIRIIKPNVGGAFGSRLGLVNEPICAFLAKESGKPVMLKYSREESFYATESRHPCIFYLKTGVKRDGTIIARQAKGILNTGAYATHGPAVTGVAGAMFASLYKCANIKYDGYAVYTNTPISGAFRGYGNPEQAWATESQIDSISYKLGIDPLELRLKNSVGIDDMGPMGVPIKSCGLKECIKIGSELIRWEEKREKKIDSNSSKRRGIGVACLIHCSGAKPLLSELSSAIVKVNEDGTAILITGSPDVGQGSSTALAQIVAEELGIDFKSINVIAGEDTEITPFDIGTHASRQAYSGGNAVRAAAEAAKRILLKEASNILEANIDDLEAKNGWIYIKGTPEKKIPISKVAFLCQYGGNPKQVIGMASLEPEGNAYPFAAQFAEVEVDTVTGHVDILKMVAVHDVGKAINPVIVEGQIEGALHQGIGFALSEEILIDNGKSLNPVLSDYRIMTPLDLPEIESVIVETNDPTHPYGVKSIGESGLVPTAPSIANAIYDAIGVRIKELPMTPEKIFKALKEIKQ